MAEHVLSSPSQLGHVSHVGSPNHFVHQLPTALRTSKPAILPTRKSVEFAIEPPTKRLKSNTPWTAKQVVDAISTSIAQNERLEAIEKAKDSFNHDVQAVHDDEMAFGADGCLLKHLTFLVHHKTRLKTEQKDCDRIMAEISMTCDAMESLYRASSEVVGSSFIRMGNDVLQVILSLIDDEIARRSQAIQPKTKEASLPESQAGVPKSMEPPSDRVTYSSADDAQRRPITPPYDFQATGLNPGTPEGDLMLRKTTKILGHFARVGRNTKRVAHFPGLMETMVNLISFKPYDCIPWESRLSVLWTVANLACNADNMQMMLRTPGLVRSMIELSSRHVDATSSLEETIEILRSRSIASRAILNLSWIATNKEAMADDAALIDLLADLAVHRGSSFNHSLTMKGIVVATRRHAVGALRNILAAPHHTKVGLCTYRNGHLLDILTDAALNDPETTVKDRAFAAIHNLAIQDTAARIAKHPALVLALKDALLSEEEARSSSEGGETTKSHASATLLVLERSINPGSDSYNNLREILDAVTPTNTNAELTTHSQHMNSAAV